MFKLARETYKVAAAKQEAERIYNEFSLRKQIESSIEEASKEGSLYCEITDYTDKLIQELQDMGYRIGIKKGSYVNRDGMIYDVLIVSWDFSE